MTLKDAIKSLTESYGDIRAEAKMYQFNESEILEAMAKYDLDSAEGVVLKLLYESSIKADKKAKK